jgi:hypothetical protein
MNVCAYIAGGAGAQGYTMKKMSKEEEALAIQELLGRLDDDAADDVADALTASALEDMGLFLRLQFRSVCCLCALFARSELLFKMPSEVAF